MRPAPEAELRALELFERLIVWPGNSRFRERLLKRESPQVIACLAQLEAGHAARAAMPTEMPDWVAAPLVEPPGRIGPFRLTERIGYGGMGDVWRSERDDGLFEQTVAIKLIHRHLSASAAQAFEAERRILAKLDHPDIVRLTDGGATDDGLQYLIMDYVDGVPFDEAVAPLPLGHRIRLFRQAAATVQFAHSRLVAHADLKPSNIMVDGAGRVRLLDFGIAGLLSGHAQATLPTGAMTREYASPQRLAGALPSIADDVFALGRILALIAGDTRYADLNAIIAKAGAGEEADRYETVAALSADLEAWQTGFPVTAQPDRFGYRTNKFVGRHRSAVIASALAIVALIATTVYATVNSIHAERARRYAAARYDDAHGISNYLMFDLIERMTNQPRSLSMRIDMAQTAQSYLDRLARVPEADAATRLDTARGFWQLAEFQSKPGHPNLGQADKAKANLKTALVIAAPLSGMRADILRGHILLDQVSLAANSDNDLDRAEKLLTQAQPIVARVAQAEPILPQIYQHQLANLRSWQGRYAEECTAAQAGLSMPPPRNPLKAYAIHDSLLDILGDCFRNTKGGEKTLKVYNEQVAFGEAAARRWPDNHMIKSRLMYARLNEGMTLLWRDRSREALPVLEQANREALAEIAFEPADRWTQAQWRSIDTTRAQALGFLGRTDEALAVYRGWEARLRAKWEVNPQDVAPFRAYVQVRAMIGEAQDRAKRTADQCATDRGTLGLYDRMANIGALTQWDADINLKELKARLARSCA